MKKAKSWILPLSLLVMVELIKTQPLFIEKYYSSGIYPYIGRGFRWLFGWLPFSLGDSLIFLLCLWVLIRVIIFFRKKASRHELGSKLKQAGFALLKTLLYAYTFFYLLWGLNYYRAGASYLFKIEPGEYVTTEVDSLVNRLHLRLQSICTDSLGIEQQKTNNRKQLMAEAKKAWELAAGKYPFLNYKNPSLKPNLIGPLQSYTGYAGYMFPFTGEAQVNFYVPSFSLPFTVCHEMAHQLGFGSESEANLIGFLTARESPDKAFQYSAYTGIHLYALRELYLRDSTRASDYINRLPPIFIKDRLEQRKFAEAHESFMQPALNAAYNFYLLSNNQPEGLETYNYVVAWLIAYGKKYGWDKL